ncbi:gonadotropin subunit beta-1-like [Cottoperca gobio]|uniref:Gonadotropin subunit beta-1-like n=1 Tax=Cottoperca gobio TaxID=56716 RepID=A0A6J2S814_COTGO|nr:gonadotropin subunit beta-1-like [Cottoperca gobio]
MQLVVMAALLSLAGAGPGCSSRCHLTTIPIPVESCRGTEYILTNICAGQCETEAENLIDSDELPLQKSCNGDWSYEVAHIKGCQVGVRYPVARNCTCRKCNGNNTDCGPFRGNIANCLSI